MLMESGADPNLAGTAALSSVAELREEKLWVIVRCILIHTCQLYMHFAGADDMTGPPVFAAIMEGTNEVSQ